LEFVVYLSSVTRGAADGGSAGALGYAEPPISQNGGALPKHKLRLLLYVGLFVVDCSSILIGFMLASLLNFGDPFSEQGQQQALLLLPIFAFAAFHLKAYSLDVLKKPRLGVYRAGLALSATVMIILLAAFFLKESADYSRMILGLGTLLSFVSMFIARFLLGRAGLRWMEQNV
jgi:hypothetical protein